MGFPPVHDIVTPTRCLVRLLYCVPLLAGTLTPPPTSCFRSW